MGILFLKSIFGFISSWFSTAWKFILTYPKQAIIILCLAAGILGGLKVKNSFDELKTENVALVAKAEHLQQESAQLKLDVAAAVQVNTENKKVIESLSIAATESKQQVVELKAKQQTNQTKIEVIRTVIAESKPQDDGPVAKVLKETIDAIQKDREATK
jgi:heme/copper-type cytochrome/quinol oxidase subunit 2